MDCIRFYGRDVEHLWREYGIILTATIVSTLPDDGALMRHLGEGWRLTDHLLAVAIDRLVEANWQRSSDGQKGRRRPKPIRRPGVVDDKSSKIGGARMSLQEAKSWVASRLGRREK